MTRQFLRSVVPIFAMACIGLGACSNDPSTSTPHRAPDVYVSDAAISTQVKSAFAIDSKVSLSDVEVETYNGVVQLSGFVDDQAESDRAVELARGVKGVRDVKNDTRIKSAALSTK